MQFNRLQLSVKKKMNYGLFKSINDKKISNNPIVN